MTVDIPPLPYLHTAAEAVRGIMHADMSLSECETACKFADSRPEAAFVYTLLCQPVCAK